jgi:hypothetical protein
MKKLSLVIAFLVLAVPASASELTADQPGEISSDQPGEISSSQKGEINSSNSGEINLHQQSEITTNSPGVDPALCRALVKHTPDADVAYQSGVDAAGRPIAPADLPGQPQIKLADKINIPLTLSLVKALNLNTSTYPYNQLGDSTEMPLGTLTIEGDKVFLNGSPLNDTQQDNLAVLCMKPH